MGTFYMLKSTFFYKNKYGIISKKHFVFTKFNGCLLNCFFIF